MEVKVGDIVEGLFNGAHFPAVVENVDGELVQVEFLGYKNKERFPIEALRKLVRNKESSSTLSAVEPLDALQCFYPGDGAWHEVVVEKITPFGFIVLFTAYQTREEVKALMIWLFMVFSTSSLYGLLFFQVPLQYLRRTKEALPAAPAAPARPIAAAGDDDEIDGNDGFVIPHHLKLNTTDTEEQILKKKKKIKALKMSAKKTVTEDIQNSKQVLPKTPSAVT
jgi:hypothetical protein